MNELEIAPRIKPIENLQKQFFHRDEEELIFFDGLESQQVEYAPTIGAEIEVTWSSMFPKSAKRWFANGRSGDDFTDSELEEFDQLCNELDTETLPRFEAVAKAGVPKGKDAYWEFAHNPARNYQTLAKEIGMLMSKNVGVIPTANELSMHVTIGGVEYGSGLFYVLSAAEITGGTNGSRIRSATENRHVLDRTWARKGPTGLYVRMPGELIGTKEGSEMRTFVADSPDQVRSTLRTVQMLGTALNGCRDYRSGNKTAIGHRLFLTWKQLVLATKLAFSDAGLDDANTKWMAPFEKTKPWKELADFIDGERAVEVRDIYSGIVRKLVHETELNLLSHTK